MVKTSIIITAIIVIANTLAGIILSGYSTFHMVISNMNIMSSGLLLTYVFQSTSILPLKIGATSYLILSGFIRFLVALFSPDRFQDNYALVVLIVLIALELICLVIINTIDKKKKRLLDEFI